MKFDQRDKTSQNPSLYIKKLRIDISGDIKNKSIINGTSNKIVFLVVQTKI
jgi:hypothetical protein